VKKGSHPAKRDKFSEENREGGWIVRCLPRKVSGEKAVLQKVFRGREIGGGFRSLQKENAVGGDCFTYRRGLGDCDS